MAKTENIVNEVDTVMDKKVEIEMENNKQINKSIDPKENVFEENEFVKLTLADIVEKITIKDRISVLAKQDMVQTVYNTYVKKDEINGIYYRDNIMKDVAFNLSALGHYTDFYNVVENAVNYDYDYLYEIGLFRYILNNVNADDIQLVISVIDDFSKRVDDLNDIGCFLYRIVDNATKNMPKIDLGKILKEIPKAINGIDKDVVKAFAGEFKTGNIVNIANGKKKN